MNNKTEYELASDFMPLQGEANFPPPIQQEVVGGVHIAPECITRLNGKFVMVVWPNGLPRHEIHKTVRFPHGLMLFGETLKQTAERLTKEQFGMEVTSVKVLDMDSYVDDKNHWHIEPLLLVEVTGEPNLHKEASHLVYFSDPDELPKDAVWSKKGFIGVIDSFLK